MDILAKLNALDPIREDAVELRCDVDFHWPEGLEPNQGAALTLHSAIREAGNIFREFRSVRDESRSNTKLTAEGAFAEIKAWADGKLLDLERLRERTRDRMVRAEREIMSALTADFSEAPDEPVAEMRLAELRAWVARLPDDKREDIVRQRLTAGDRQLMRAIATSPAPYLVGLTEENIAEFREDMARSTDPEKFDRLQKLRSMAVVADRACDGVHRLLRQETSDEAERWAKLKSPANASDPMRRTPQAVGAR